MIDKVRECMTRGLELDSTTVEEINERTTAADLPKWTSVSHLSLVLELEKTFDITFDNEEIISLGSVSAILESLTNKGVQ